MADSKKPRKESEDVFTTEELLAQYRHQNHKKRQAARLEQSPADNIKAVRGMASVFKKRRK